MRDLPPKPRGSFDRVWRYIVVLDMSLGRGIDEDNKSHVLVERRGKRDVEEIVVVVERREERSNKAGEESGNREGPLMAGLGWAIKWVGLKMGQDCVGEEGVGL